MKISDDFQVKRYLFRKDLLVATPVQGCIMVVEDLAVKDLVVVEERGEVERENGKWMNERK